ncbi:glycosyltransferase family 2 protein [Aliarcobacter butzleri]|uniref:glycosyltransferase family 2 protein n=1 Tax=Aliarcobacter butzleri TaxID=28197 RepID=UPI0021B4271C|nr:glycosyltransferase family 2 protein [Aliarcobacter butzleri]MCT7537431.1 glycosyltransferase family 2 protein [Aliarcobacter butzleri]MCT7623910.1 glycosyltransferase family 2 protein [Aliarcobacter butzleri]
MHRIIIIVVAYNPNVDELKNNIDTYYEQSDFVILVDNSTSIEISTSVIDTFKAYNNMYIITLGNNYGIAYAQNIGIKYAIEKGYRYFIEMDQDSKLPEKYVDHIYNSYVELQKISNKIAGIGPIAFNKKDNSQYHSRNSNSEIIEVDKTLSSGFFCSLEAINIVGFKNEDLFIDLVDWEWCWRAKGLGYKTYVDTTLKLPHMLGEGHKNFLFFKLGIPAPIRHYYQYRNALLLNKMNHVPIKWKIKRILIHLFKPIFFLCFYDKRIERIKYIIKGVKDGILGRSGKIN